MKVPLNNQIRNISVKSISSIKLISIGTTSVRSHNLLGISVDWLVSFQQSCCMKLQYVFLFVSIVWTSSRKILAICPVIVPQLACLRRLDSKGYPIRLGMKTFRLTFHLRSHFYRPAGTSRQKFCCYQVYRLRVRQSTMVKIANVKSLYRMLLCLKRHCTI